jgi:uncharacterized protein (DUF305 family)
MNSTLLRTTLASAALLGVLSLAGCSNNDDMSGMPGHASSASPTAAASGTATTSAEFNDADVTFAQMMIPHHQQAVQMSDMILAKEGVNPEVISLAQQIKAAQQPEIDTMKSWLSAWGRPTMAGGHEMGDGKMTEEEMRALDEADGPEAQKLFLEGMIKHHRGAIAMAQTEIANGKNPDAIALARSIVDTQQKEITTIEGLLAKL